MNDVLGKHTPTFTMVEFEIESELVYSDDEQREFIEHHADVAPPFPLEPEDWQSWYSDDLLNMWSLLTRYINDSAIYGNMLSDCTYSEFCNFVYSRSRHGASYRNGFNFHY